MTADRREGGRLVTGRQAILDHLMFKISVSVTVPNLDKHQMSVTCPLCDLDTPTTLGAIRLGDTIVCRGCHSNIKLEDHLGGYHSFRRWFAQSLKDLET